MRPIWKGSISFGLVTIPISVFPATSSAEKISFKMLRQGDLSPIRYKRVAEADGKEVAWDDIVKGYEYEKEKFVVFTDKDFDAVELTSTDTIAIQDFVELDQIDPIFFHTPYYLEPMKGGGGAYGLLRDVLSETGKVGIAKVTMRNREHLAAVKADKSLLVMELMHFAHEIAPADAIKVPADRKIGAREKEMAKTLVNQMSSDWNPEQYKDEYAAAVMKLVDEKVKAGGKEIPGHKKHAAAATNVVDLVKVLQESLAATGKSGGASRTAKPASAPKKKRTTHRHAPAHRHAA
ncbi:MAG TPA: Ku protein [Opitutaceae bacterium]|nr:Ku protein [Opitutaceae bacterium]